MRALLANKFFFRNGGSEVVLFQERDFLLHAGFEVIDFSMKDSRNFQSPYAGDFVTNQSYETKRGALSKVRAALNLIHSHEAVAKIGQIIDRTRPDIVHCHNIYHQLTPSIISAAKRRGVPVVLTLHDYKPICPTYLRLQGGHVCSECVSGRFWNVIRHRCADGSLGKSALLFAEAQVQRLLQNYEKVDLFVAPSAFMSDSVTQHRIAKERVRIIYNGIDCRTISTTEEDHGYALYLGRLAPEKGIETLLAAHAEIAGQVPLVVAGTGPLEQRLRALYPEARYVGHLGGARLENTIRKASLIVVPSEWYENCPMSVLEAMAYGKPVVASEIGGIPELVVHEATGLLFPPGDRNAIQGCLVQLMADADLRQSYGQAARQRALEHFSLELHNSKLLHVYQTLIAGARSKSRQSASQHVQTPQE